MSATPKSVSLPQYDNLWYAHGLRFRCTQCGNCCTGGPGYVWVNQQDMEKIAAFLQLPFDDFTGKYVRQIGRKYSLQESVKGPKRHDCVFLTFNAEGKGGCSIYPVRPMQCRTWPFWDYNLSTPEDWTIAAAHCPGMCDAEAPLYPVEHIEKCRTDPGSP